MSRRRLLWCVALFFALHNAEEAIAFRPYLPRIASLLPAPLAIAQGRLSYPALLLALAVVTGLGLAAVIVADRRPGSRGALWAVLVLQATIGINALAHIVIASLLFRGYGPGLLTAALVNAPFSVYFFRRAARERWLSSAALRATVPAAIVLHGPVLLGGLWLASRAQ